MAGLEQYIPPNLRRGVRELSGMGTSLLDNVIGLDDGYDSAGERLKRQFRADPAGMAKQMGGGILSGVADAVTSPIDTVKGAVQSVGQSMVRAGRGADAYLPEGVTLQNATPVQIRAANDAFTSDMLGGVGVAIPAVGPALKGVGAAGRLAGQLEIDPNAVGSMGGNIRLKKATKGELDPLGYQDTKMDKFLSDVEIDQVDLGENLPRVARSWEELENKLVLPFYGDRTSRGMSVEGVDDVSFENPVYTEGGVDFMRGPAAQANRSIWASNSNIVKRIADESQKARDIFEGEDVYGMTGSMAPNANDFATMTGAAMAELVKGAKITKKSAKQFDGIMKVIDPTFVGVKSPKLREWATSASSPNRKSFIRLMDTSPAQAAGFPSPAKARLSVTDPTQRDMGAGMFGLGVSKIDELSPILREGPPVGNYPPMMVPHSTYNTQITGDYFGALPPVPQGLLFRDVYDAMEGKTTKAGQPLSSAHKTHAIKTKMPVQRVTPNVLEGILDYLANRAN